MACQTPSRDSLDLALVGNGAIGALIDAGGTVVCVAFPLRWRSGFRGPPRWRIAPRLAPELRIGSLARADEQDYATDTPVLVTALLRQAGWGIEITDFCPRFGGAEKFLSGDILSDRCGQSEGSRNRSASSPPPEYGSALAGHG